MKRMCVLLLVMTSPVGGCGWGSVQSDVPGLGCSNGFGSPLFSSFVVLATGPLAGDGDGLLSAPVKIAATVLLLLALGVGWSLEKGRQKRALRRSEERFKLAMNAVQDGLWDWDFKSGEIYLSPGFYTLLGWAPGAFPGRRDEWNKRIHEDDRERVVAAVDAHLRNATLGTPGIDIEFQMQTREGSYRHVLCRGNIVGWDTSGKALRGVGTLADITRRKRAEEKQELSRKALRTVLDSIDAFVYVADMDTYELLFLNRYGKQQWGDLTGQTCWQVLQTDQPGPCSFCTNSKLLDQDGEPTGPYRWEFQNTVNGRWCDISDRAIHWVDGRIVRLEIATDITERKAAEAELVKARMEAEQANVFKSRFLANMSHEIRTPLNVIVGMSHLLQQTELSSSQDGYIGNIRDSAHVLMGVINDVLDLSKIESGRFVIEQTPFLMCEVLDRLGGLLGAKAAEKGVEILFSVEPTVPPALVGDPLRLEQVLLNLVQNAVKFTEAGEIEVGIRPGVQTGESAELEFFVSDTGIGIDSGRLESVFEAFIQGDSSTSRKHGGSGLGLTICKHLVELMGGRIRAESTPGVGSRFSFSLRFSLPETPQPSPGFDLEGHKVLLIEKNTNVRRALSVWLQALSAQVEQASSARRGLEMAARAAHVGDPYDILIIDGEMTSPDLRELFAEFDALQGSQVPPAIVMSPYRNRGTELVARFPSKQSVFLAKPVCPSKLMAVVRAALDPEVADDVAAGEQAGNRRKSLLKGKKVLVVEDDSINQQVVEGLLENLGIESTIAGGGRAAIDAVAESRFDLVLMDVQMPDMDGLQATQHIREHLGAVHLPVIALTAHAMKGDRDRCLAAGMNDHVTKPIDPDRLYETLVKWMGETSGALTRKEARPAVDEGVDDDQHGRAQDAVYLDIEDGVKRVGGSRSTYVRLVRQFVADHGGVAESLRSALVAGEVDRIRRLTHTLQGVAGNLGADRLAKAARELGAAVGKAPEWNVQRHLAVLEATLAEVVEVADSLEGGPTTVLPDPNVNGGALVQELVDIAAMLREGNVESLDRLRALRAGDQPECVQSLLDRAEAQVRAYDYEQALNSVAEAAHLFDIDIERRAKR